MITNTGKNIIAKYLVGQAPAYASYIALGVGPSPLDDLDPIGDYSNKENLDFEAFRIPITSRGYVYDENGDANIVFSGELPSDQRYEITEVGIFSGKSNPAAAALDSKNLYTFGESENWEYHTAVVASSIPTETGLLDGGSGENEINLIDDNGQPVEVFRTNSDNVLFNNTIRLQRFERPRFLDKALIIAGNISTIDADEETGIFSIDPISNHIHLADISPNFNRNSPLDELRLAFSLIDKDSQQIITPERLRIMIEFSATDTIDPTNYARMEIEITKDDENFNNKRYFVVNKSLESLIKSTGFTWNTVNVAKIYVSVFELDGATEVVSENFYIALDGLRLENVTSQNPLYGMVGYTVIRNENDYGYAEPIIKSANSANSIEFRFGVDVL